MKKRYGIKLVLKKVELAKEIIDYGWSNPNLSIKTLSQRIGLEGEVLGRLFKKRYEEKITDRINGLRIKGAEIFLGRNHHKISAIASITGFSSRTHFTRVFKKAKKVSPEGYQKGLEKCNIFSDDEIGKMIHENLLISIASS